MMTTHTYLDGIGSFPYRGLWAVETLHSTATLSIQRVSVVCMGFGSCTVSIFSCPTSATLAGWAPFFMPVSGSNPNLKSTCFGNRLGIQRFNSQHKRFFSYPSHKHVKVSWFFLFGFSENTRDLLHLCSFAAGFRFEV
ncbi:hypothetical protein Moror_1573 [Moniliophthora roreri MCA 2997]|uniref:Uncharacterized protein n=1 Tax=Moniliophthora roreri (strain MCA 2997) TaxID=1381753 RepID=V2XIL5_MONRO|nr:hypothetical protein Moror_1573 [Moniliophthora roreri MCA 2997]